VSEKKPEGMNSGLQVNDDMLDYVCNDVEGFACGENAEDLRDTRILQKPALKYEKDALDKVCEPLESIVCRDSSSEHVAKSTQITQQGAQYSQTIPKGQTGKNMQENDRLFGYVSNYKSLVSCHQSEYVTNEVDQKYEKDVLDRVFEPLESMVCRDNFPEAQNKAAVHQNGRLVDRLRESAIRSAAFRESEVRTAGLQSRKRDPRGTGAVPRVLQYDERDALDNVFESIEGLVCREPSAKGRNQRRKDAFEPVGSVGYRNDTPAVGGDWESVKPDAPTEQTRDVETRAADMLDNVREGVESVAGKQDARGFRGDKYLTRENDKYYMRDNNGVIDSPEETLERRKQSTLKNNRQLVQRNKGDLLDFVFEHVESAVCKEGMPEEVVKKERPKRTSTSERQYRHDVNWRDE
jgi:hypothetical protein